MFILAGWITAWPAAGAAWKWIAYGDTRTDDAAHRSVLQAIRGHSPDYKFIINVGDVVAVGSDAAQWEAWQKACDNTLGGTGQALVPPGYMAVPGNHDQVPGSGRLYGQSQTDACGRLLRRGYVQNLCLPEPG